MQIEARPESFGIFDGELARTVARSLRWTRAQLLKITVGSLVILWWLQMFGVWSGTLQWAAALGITPPVE